MTLNKGLDVVVLHN